MEAKIQKVKLFVIIEHHRLTGKAKQAQETDKPKGAEARAYLRDFDVV